MEWLQWPLTLIFVAGAVRAVYEWIKQRGRIKAGKRRKYNEI
ncbi:hypothetical protein AHMF7616_00689 [Adhaeribacter pallidiroseus]|uniref:Uncharacterized protein n=1 Tax=Adhaeribacter pallidiroseus TaxID=2072847 RepID=A0A369QIH6_9BACT|nr:hypothetical protein AHMF7616_00689 [Adhaeribacter pallidiroseus]